MNTNGLSQRELAAKLGLDPTTLNNFFNRQTKTLGGLAVALACTIVDLACDGAKIGRLGRTNDSKPLAGAASDRQLVLEFDEGFEVNREAGRPTVILRKPAARHETLRLVIRRTR